MVKRQVAPGDISFSCGVTENVPPLSECVLCCVVLCVCVRERVWVLGGAKIVPVYRTAIPLENWHTQHVSN